MVYQLWDEWETYFVDAPCISFLSSVYLFIVKIGKDNAIITFEDTSIYYFLSSSADFLNYFTKLAL